MEQLAKPGLPGLREFALGSWRGCLRGRGTPDARTHPSRPATLPLLDPMRQEDFRLGVPEDLNSRGEGTWGAQEWAVAAMVCV